MKKYNSVQYGGDSIGFFTYNNNTYVSKKSQDGYIYSFTEKNVDMVDRKDITKKVKPNKNKVLFIETMKIFDDFTNKYCILYKPYGDNEPYVVINWRLLINDFKGLYVDRNNLLMLYRKEYALFKKKRVISWLKMEDLSYNIMMFN